MKLAIIGQGGHSKVIEDLLSSVGTAEIVARLDDKYNECTSINSILTGPVTAATGLFDIFPDIKFIIAVGNNHVRKAIVDKLGFPKEAYATLIHPTAVISMSTKIGAGSIIMARAIIQADTQIGDQVIINSGAIVEHDNVIKDYVHLSPGVVTTGNVIVESGTHIGAGAVIIPGTKIGKWATVGAGATVTLNIPDYSTAVGVPAKVLKKEVTNK